MSLARAACLLATSTMASAGYVVVSRAVERHETAQDDGRARRRIEELATQRAKRAAKITGHIGKWYVHLPLALASAALVERRGSGAIVVGTSLAATALSHLLDRVMSHRTPPPGKGDPNSQSYPSGHALETTAVAIAATWILARERVVTASIAAPLAAVASIVSGAGRVILDRHWVTDGAGGYAAGMALGTAAAATYELLAD